MEYFSQERPRTDWTRFLQFLRLLGHKPAHLPNKIVGDAKDGEHNFVLLFACLPLGEWALFYHTETYGGANDIFLLWRSREQERVIQFKFMESSEALSVPTATMLNPSQLQHLIPLPSFDSNTDRFLYIWYFLNRMYPGSTINDEPLPEYSCLHEAFSNAHIHYIQKRSVEQEAFKVMQSRKRSSPLRYCNNPKRMRFDEYESFPEFNEDSAYARFFTPQTLTKYLILLDVLEKFYSKTKKVQTCTFIDILVKVQNDHLFSDEIYRLKDTPDFKTYFPSGSPKPAKLRNLAGFLFELFTDIMEPTSDDDPCGCKVIFGSTIQQARILSRLDKEPQGSLIDIAGEEFGDDESLWRILYRYLSARQWTDLTAST
jgi:hypothetical protein